MTKNASDIIAELEAEAETGTALAIVEKREKKVRRDFWKKFKRVVGVIPFSRDLLAAYFCALDPNTPLRARATLLGALVYFILPIDFVPDIIAGLGFADDATVLFAAIKVVSTHVNQSHYDRADKALAATDPEKPDAL